MSLVVLWTLLTSWGRMSTVSGTEETSVPAEAELEPVAGPDPAQAHHPWTRYVALGDSFTEGIGDPDPSRPGYHRGWADRIAQELASQTQHLFLPALPAVACAHSATPWHMSAAPV